MGYFWRFVDTLIHFLIPCCILFLFLNIFVPSGRISPTFLLGVATYVVFHFLRLHYLVADGAGKHANDPPYTGR